MIQKYTLGCSRLVQKAEFNSIPVNCQCYFTHGHMERYVGLVLMNQIILTAKQVMSLQKRLVTILSSRISNRVVIYWSYPILPQMCRMLSNIRLLVLFYSNG